jgi:hypothetical protein
MDATDRGAIYWILRIPQTMSGTLSGRVTLHMTKHDHLFSEDSDASAYVSPTRDYESLVYYGKGS